MGENQYYLGAESHDLTSPEEKQKLTQRLRQYLELRNVTFLLGNGCSIPLGAPLIHAATAIRSELNSAPHRLHDDAQQRTATEFLDKILKLQPTIGIEPLLTLLANLQANATLLQKKQTLGDLFIDGNQATGEVPVSADDVRHLDGLLKKWIYHRCEALSELPDEQLIYHEELLRRILLRSTALPRAKIFTTNYDLVLEHALDHLGILYFDGFLGTISRTLRSESYHYDLYYPGETTEGRVSRVDRVLHLYKMHGSINWRRNRLDVIIKHTKPNEHEYGNVMVYPSPLKTTEMNGYPYSEMFRHFSAQIHQPQSALFTVGYGFQDDHINRLIYQALSIPSFALIIVTPEVKEPADKDHLQTSDEVYRLTRLDSKRILVITGAQPDKPPYIKGAGTIQEFSTVWMPDISELAVEREAREEARKALKPLTDSAAPAPDGPTPATEQ